MEAATSTLISDIYEMKINFIKFNSEKISGYDIRLLVEFSDDPKIFSTVLNHCSLAISQYYGVYGECIAKYALQKRKKFDVIKEILLIEKSFLNPDLCNSLLEQADRLDVVKLLIECGANVDYSLPFGDKKTLLMKVVEVERDTEIVLELIKHSSNLNLTNFLGQTILHLSLLYNYDEVVIREICDKTMDVNKKDFNNLTPLCYALGNKKDSWNCYELRNVPESLKRYEKTFIIELINKGFVVDKTVFLHAISYCEKNEIVEELTKYFDYKSIDSEGNCLLHFVKDVKQVDFLIRKGLPVNHLNNCGRSPLFNAVCSCKNFDVMVSLLSWGADPNSLLSNLDWLSVYNSNFPIQDVLYFLFSYGLNVNTTNVNVKNILPLLMDSLVDPVPKNERTTLFKHIFVSNNNIMIPDWVLENKNARNYLQELNNEFNKMKEQNIINNLSFYNFCIKQYKSRRCHIKVTNCKFVNNYHELREVFPNFCDDIIAKIRHNYQVQSRITLQKKLLKLSVRCVMESNNNNIDVEHNKLKFNFVQLQCDCLFNVGCYLIDRDIYSLLSASTLE